jgi:hypothetical protein
LVAGLSLVGGRPAGPPSHSAPGGGGLFRVLVVENVTTQEVGYLLDEALEKSRSLACGSVITVDMIAINFWISASWVSKYSGAKAGEPTGDPRRWKPVVSLAGKGGPRTSMSFGASQCGVKILKGHILRVFFGDRLFSRFKITNYYKRNSKTTPP